MPPGPIAGDPSFDARKVARLRRLNEQGRLRVDAHGLAAGIVGEASYESDRPRGMLH